MRYVLIAISLFIFTQISAETVTECVNRHPNADIVLFSKGLAKEGSDLDFGIERIAIYTADLRIYIKKAETHEEIVRYIDDAVELGDRDWTLKLDGGGAVIILQSKQIFIYVPSSNTSTMATHDIDYEKTAEFSEKAKMSRLNPKNNKKFF